MNYVKTPHILSRVPTGYYVSFPESLVVTLRVPRGHAQRGTNNFFGNSKILKKAYEGHNIVEQKT